MSGLFIGDSMDRQITYPGQLLAETSLLQATKDAMISVAKLSSAMLGTGNMASGFAVTPTGPASLQVVCAPGEIYSMTAIDALAFSSLPADTTHSILKQGILLDGVTLSCPAPGTSGQSINYLIQVTYQDTDSTPVLLPYYNSANPALPYSGMGNNGLTQNTIRKGAAVVSVKAGASATTGSQATPAPDVGNVGLYVVTVAFGQTTITAGSIAQYSGAQMLPSGLLQAVQNGTTGSANDIGTANAYAANFTPAVTALSDKMFFCVKAANANTGASTFTPAPGVIAPAPIVGAAHLALQGGEIVATGDLWLQWNSSIGAGSWILIDSTGGAQQIAPAISSRHALRFDQVSGIVGQSRNLKASITVAAATATWAADEVILETALGGLRYCIPSVSQTINLATTGTNGMDTGLAPASGYVAIYAICTSAGVLRLLGVNATSTAAPYIYAGANMPSGYIASALLSVVPTNASRQFVAFEQVDDWVGIARQTFYGGSGGLTVSPISLSAVVPLNARFMIGGMSNSSTAASNIGFSIFGTAGQAGEQNISGTVVAGGAIGGNFILPIPVAQTAYGTTTNTAGTPTFTAFATGYRI